MIADQHPRLVAELARLVKRWDFLTDSNRQAWIVDVLDGFADRGEYEISSRDSMSGKPVTLTDDLVDRFLSRTEVADWLDIAPSSLSRYKMPAPDAVIGKVRGWRTSTIADWDASRPGRGRWRKS